ncbi:AGAP007989-PA-like protein [Anopheles sinensis]|uniref:AGAP007989-PA-like protein n=1 Tax=Anopheles sinensis TaxID=74873 RepID=A0A084W4X6_ANOSI|nr:AGAP007989-PA-like protein [Anopheles sinensis]
MYCDKVQDDSGRKSNAIVCSRFPAAFYNKAIAKAHFAKYGIIKDYYVLAPKRILVVIYDRPEAALRARNLGAWYQRKKLDIRLSQVPLDPVNVSKSRPSNVAVDLALDGKSICTDRKVLEARNEFITLAHQSCSKVQDRYRVLDARDRYINLCLEPRSSARNVSNIIGACEDMCPEKERYLRTMRGVVPPFERSDVVRATGQLDYKKAVKQFSLPHTGGALPSPYDLRTVPALGRSMRFLLENVVGRCDSENGANLLEWFNYMDDRLRAIRWEITQRELFSATTIKLMEQCTRFYIYCVVRMAADETLEFDQQKNTDSILDCLRDLKRMYSFEVQQRMPCVTEAEFRGFLLLMYLNSEEFNQELQQMSTELRETPVVQFAISVRCALSEKNFVRFFALLRATQYFNACILLRYVPTVREMALSAMRGTFLRDKPTCVELAKLTDALCFRTEDDAVKFFDHYRVSVIRPTGTVVFDPYAVSYQPDKPYCSRTDGWLVEREQRCSVVNLIRGSSVRDFGIQYRHLKFHSSFDSRGFFKKHLIAKILAITPVPSAAPAPAPESNDAHEEVIYISSDSEDNDTECVFGRETKEMDIDRHRPGLSVKVEVQTVETQPERISVREQMENTPEVPSAEFHDLTLADGIRKVPENYSANHASVKKEDGQTMASMEWGRPNETSVNGQKKVVVIDSLPAYSSHEDSDTVPDSSSLEDGRQFPNKVWQLRERCDSPAESIGDALRDHQSYSSEEAPEAREQQGDSACGVSESNCMDDNQESLPDQHVRKPGDQPYNPCSPTSTSCHDELDDEDALVNDEHFVEPEIYFKAQEIDRPYEITLEDRSDTSMECDEGYDQEEVVVVISDDGDSHQSCDFLLDAPLEVSEVNNNAVQEHIQKLDHLKKHRITEEDLEYQDQVVDRFQQEKQNSEEQGSSQCSADFVDRACCIGTKDLLEIAEENTNRNTDNRITDQTDQLQTQEILQNRNLQDDIELHNVPIQGRFSREEQDSGVNDHSQSTHCFQEFAIDQNPLDSTPEHHNFDPSKISVQNYRQDEAHPQNGTSGELPTEDLQEDIELIEDLDQYEGREEGEENAVLMELNANELESEELIEDDRVLQVNPPSSSEEEKVRKHLIRYISEKEQTEMLEKFLAQQIGEFAGIELATANQARRKQYRLARKYCDLWLANVRHAVRCRLLLRSVPLTGQESNNWSRGVKLCATVGKEEPIEPFGILKCAVRSEDADLREPYYWKLVISIPSDDGMQDEKRCCFNSFINRWLLEAAFKKDADDGEQPEHPFLYFATSRSSSPEAAICVRVVRDGVDSPEEAHKIYDRCNGLLFVMNVYEPIEQVRERFRRLLSMSSETRPAVAVLHYCPNHRQPGNVGEELKLDMTVARWKVFRWRNLTDNDPLRAACVFLAGYYRDQQRDFAQDPGRLEMSLLTAFLSNTVGSEWWSGLEGTCKKDANGGSYSLLGQNGNAVVQLYNVALDRVRYMVAREQLVSFARIPAEFDFLRARRPKSPDGLSTEALIPPDWSSAERFEQLKQLLTGMKLHPLPDLLLVAMERAASGAVLGGCQVDTSQLRVALECYLREYPVFSAGNTFRIKLLVHQLAKEVVSQFATDSSISAQHPTGTFVWIPLLAHVSEAVMRNTIMVTKTPAEVCYRRSELARFLKAPWAYEGLVSIPRPSSLAWRNISNVPRGLQLPSDVATTPEPSGKAHSLMPTDTVLGSRKRSSTGQSVFESKLPKMNSGQLEGNVSIWSNTDVSREK